MRDSYLSVGGALLICLAAIWTTDVLPQSASFGCNFAQVANKSTHILHCPRGARITPEAGARYSLVDRDQDGNADGVILRRKALLLEVESTSGAGFVVITPQAIAAVRGTKWAVDVLSGKTAVFVVNGRVGVRRPSSSAGVVLGPGEGVDVEPGTSPLTIKRWPATRVFALLARLGE